MLRNFILLLALAGYACSQQSKSSVQGGQLRALKKLLKGLDAGVLTTCNIVLFSELVTYDVADKKCKNFDIGSGRGEKGNLVTVNDDDKNDDLKLLLEMAYPEKDQPSSKWTDTKWVWAGLRKTKNNKDKKPGKYDSLDWEWADGSHPTDFKKWMKRQPDQRALKPGQKGCNEKPRCFQNQMRVNHKGQWDDTYKYKTHPYACDYQGKYVLSNEPKTWVQAKEACAAAGLSLAMVRNTGEVEEMKAAMRYFLGEGDTTWKTFDARNWVWLGGNDIEEEGVFKWLNGDLVETWDIPWRPEAGGDNAGYLPGFESHHLLLHLFTSLYHKYVLYLLDVKIICHHLKKIFALPNPQEQKTRSLIFVYLFVMFRNLEGVGTPVQAMNQLVISS